MRSARRSVGRCGRWAVPTVAMALLAAAVLAQPAPPETGTAVPDFTLPDLDGAEHTLSERTGAGPVVLVFFRGAW